MPKAFPSAYGFGADSTSGGRGGTVLYVTNTNDSGAGSARAALTASGARHIIPTVGGICALTSDISIDNPNVTWHGHLAPGGGFFFRNKDIRINTNNVIIRHLRSFPGHTYTDQMNGLMVYGPNQKYNIVLDHCSAGWSDDQCMDAYGEFWNVTFQWNLIAEASLRLNAGYGSLIGRPTSYATTNSISLHHNVWALNRSRPPAVIMYVGGGNYSVPQVQIDFRNNLIYWWNGNNRTSFTRHFYSQAAWDAFKLASGPTSTVMQVNVIGNHWIKSPTSTAEADAFTVGLNVKVFAQNNLGPVSASPVDGFAIKVTLSGKEYEGAPANYFLDGAYDNTDYIAATEYPFPFVPTHDATAIFDLLTASAGAILPTPDSVWTRIMGHIIAGDGAFGAVLDYPTLATGSYPTTSQSDGIPDAWKTAEGLNAGSNYAGSYAEDGYDWVEKYSHSVADEPISGPRIVNPGTTPAFAWDEVSGVTKVRVFVQWDGKKRWWECPEGVSGVKADGSGTFNVVGASPVALPSSPISLSARQYDTNGDPLEAETAQVEFDNS